MRRALVEALVDLASEDDRVFLLTADLGWNALEPFREAFPERFLNVGVAEQNLAGIATGLALLGFVPFMYSIATFASMRCYEQIRNGAVLHALPVRIIGMGGGYSYGHAGPTHYALEDLAILRAQPTMAVLVPADPEQTRACVLATRGLTGPVYLRIGKGGNPIVPGLEGRFRYGEAELIREGTKVLILACGAIASEACGAAALLEEKGISPAVAVMAHLPFHAGPGTVALFKQFNTVATIEEGYIVGGLGSLAAETIAQNCLDCRLVRVGVDAPLNCDSGSERFMRSLRELDAEAIAGRLADVCT
jgi:transketolase